MQNKIFEIEKLNFGAIKNNIKAEYKNIKLSTLGGKDRASLIFYISLDKKNDWQFGIFQNSRYYILNLSITGELESFSRGQDTNKIRKTRVKDIDGAIEYINKKINKGV